MKNILLPTDFSDNSLNAINYALQLFKNWECSFYILNIQKQSEFILDDFMTESPNSSIHNTIAQDNKKELKNFVNKIRNNHTNKNFNFKLLFDFDNLIHAIKETVVSKNIDLILMGTNGATGAKEIIFGSNTLNVIRKIDCPILVIPESYKFKGIKSVLFSTDDFNNSSKTGLSLLMDLKSNYDASLDVLDIDFSNNHDEKMLRELYLKNLLEGQKHNYYSITNVPAPMVISTITQLLDYDIHALFIEPKSTFIERFLYGSDEAHEISYRTTIPLLIMRQ